MSDSDTEEEISEVSDSDTEEVSEVSDSDADSTSREDSATFTDSATSAPFSSDSVAFFFSA